jgi:antibiotic biosynthesis monooxygenase (ABM) superfamily enzyme
MIVYEVRVTVEAAIAHDYRAWLDSHIPEILAIPGFQEAELLREEGDGAHVVWTVRYHLDTREALEVYLRDHAPRLRADGQARFGNRFTATRRVLELVRNFGG